MLDETVLQGRILMFPGREEQLLTLSAELSLKSTFTSVYACSVDFTTEFRN
jgi:hypothetical protein